MKLCGRRKQEEFGSICAVLERFLKSNLSHLNAQLANHNDESCATTSWAVIPMLTPTIPAFAMAQWAKLVYVDLPVVSLSCLRFDIDSHRSELSSHKHLLKHLLDELAAGTEDPDHSSVEVPFMFQHDWARQSKRMTMAN
jgi:hypothetical protein